MARQWCLSYVTFVHPTHTVKLFGNIFSPYGSGSPLILGLPASTILTKLRRGHLCGGTKYRWGI